MAAKIGTVVRYSRDMLERAGALLMAEIATDIGEVVDVCRRTEMLSIRWRDGMIRKSRPDMIERRRGMGWKIVGYSKAKGEAV